mmetsp:Transcript_62198/g.161311  ORF Transcript_62198/g.161311 Transcript_62198/m.161311 type:complete len:255 (-) Transcript_62198:233-997(-)
MQALLLLPARPLHERLRVHVLPLRAREAQAQEQEEGQEGRCCAASSAYWKWHRAPPHTQLSWSDNARVHATGSPKHHDADRLSTGPVALQHAAGGSHGHAAGPSRSLPDEQCCLLCHAAHTDSHDSPDDGHLQRSAAATAAHCAGTSQHAADATAAAAETATLGATTSASPGTKHVPNPVLAAPTSGGAEVRLRMRELAAQALRCRQAPLVVAAVLCVQRIRAALTGRCRRVDSHFRKASWPPLQKSSIGELSI